VSSDVCDWQDVVCVIKAWAFQGRRRRSDDGRWYRLMTCRDSCIDDKGGIVISGMEQS